VSNNPLFIQDPALSYDARDFRRFLGTLVGEGVADVSGGQLMVTPRAQGANMSVDVAAGVAYIQGDTVTGQGIYQASFDATSLAIAAAPSTNSRIDLIVARITDAQVTGGPSSGRSLEVITGTAAASPTAPALPATAIPLARVLVVTGASSITAGNITDLRSALTSGNGAVGTTTRVLTTAQIAALPTPRVGELVTNADIGRVLFWNGSVWRPVGGGASGAIVVGSVFVPGSAGPAVTLSYFIGLGFEEVSFVLSGAADADSPHGGAFTAAGDPAASFGTSYTAGASNPAAYAWAPSSATSKANLTLRDNGSSTGSVSIRNLRLSSDGYLRFELIGQFSASFTTAATTRINWRAR